MKISRIRIHNFRSIQDLEIVCGDFIILLGQNNHGKSNILYALDFALATSAKPEADELFASHKDGDEDIWVELVFSDLTEQEKNTFHRYIFSDGTFSMRKTAILEDDNWVISYNGYLEEPDVIWLQSDNASQYAKRDDVAKIPLSTYVPESGRLYNKDIHQAQAKYIEDHRDQLTFNVKLEEGPLLGAKNIAAGLLPEFFLIPAVRDLSDETKVRNTAWFGKLLNHAIAQMTAKDPKLQKVLKQLEDVVSTFNVGSSEEGRPQQLIELESVLEQELSDWAVKVSIEVLPPDLNKIFELGTNLHLDDGLRTLAQKKGHGLQRAVIFGLMKAWAKILRSREDDEEEITARRASDSIYFAVEEPELFLHPHAQRSLSKALRILAKESDHQVFVSSHSTHFVDLSNYQDIVITRKDSVHDGTKVIQCKEQLFEEATNEEKKKRFHMAQWINPDRGEMLFAKRVIFVEGETEKACIPYLAEKLGLFNEDVSVIDCGSKNNLPLYIRIANAFRLDYLVIHDEDPLPEPIPDDWNQDKKRSKRGTYELNKTIESMIDLQYGSVEVLSPDFEGFCGISKSQAEKRGKALAAMEFFREQDQSRIPQKLKSVVQKSYSIDV